MNRILKKLTLKEITLEFIPSLGISLLIAESFYKFGSFAFECIAFLATWYFMGYVIDKLKIISNAITKNN
ncbi:hypothetical protein [Aquimarina sp. AU58]|uniref:hypothetical protein n=1 Tax=Aquimarina sp. AU58 TaxID=1874112 RepID=UPI000D6E1CE6|nr:hypothetical protein [Aquimarina sp. AU58]